MAIQPPITGNYTILPEPQKWRNFANQEVRLECDSTLAPVNIRLPRISALQGFLNVSFLIIDKAGNANLNPINILPSLTGPVFDKVDGGLSSQINTSGGSALVKPANAGATFGEWICLESSSSAIPPTPPPPYPLGIVAPFSGLMGGTFTVSNPGLLIPTGNVGASANVNPLNTTFGSGSFVGASPAAQAIALALYNQLKVLPATNPVNLSVGNIGDTNIGYGLGVFVPGVYKSVAGVSVVAGKTITLRGLGDYVFNIAAAMTTGNPLNIVLTDGAIASRVFFIVGTTLIGSSLTIGANNVLKGNFILGNGGVAITVGSTCTMEGRLLTTGPEVFVIDGTATNLFLPLS